MWNVTLLLASAKVVVVIRIFYRAKQSVWVICSLSLISTNIHVPLTICPVNFFLVKICPSPVNRFLFLRGGFPFCLNPSIAIHFSPAVVLHEPWFLRVFESAIFTFHLTIKKVDSRGDFNRILYRTFLQIAKLQIKRVVFSVALLRRLRTSHEKNILRRKG